MLWAIAARYVSFWILPSSLICVCPYEVKSKHQIEYFGDGEPTTITPESENWDEWQTLFRENQRWLNPYCFASGAQSQRSKIDTKQ